MEHRLAAAGEHPSSRPGFVVAWPYQSTPPRVALFAHSLTPGRGGISRVARLIAHALADAALDEPPVAVVLEDSTGGQYLPLRSAHDSRLRYAIEAHRAALSRTHFIYDSLGMSRVHCRIPPFRRRVATMIHGLESWENAGEHRVAAARRADLLVAVSDYTRRRAATIHGDLGDVRVCWLGTQDDVRPPIHRGAAGPPTVVILGQVYEQRYKGHDALIDCWAQVVSAVPDARLLIVGTGPGIPRLRHKAETSPAVGQIEFRGFVPEGAMPALWDEATVMAMPSRGEGFGLVYVEAMQHAVPVIASIHDAASEINAHGETGYNVSLDDPNDLPDRLIALLRDRDAAARLGANGQRRWAEHFTYSAFRNRFTPILREFLAL